MAIADAIHMEETRGDTSCSVNGKSGENGCLQYLPETWEMWSTDVLGYVAPMTYINERYVAANKIQSWLDQGYTAYQVALIWNAGRPVEIAGVNKYGVKYDSAAYAKRVMAYYQ